MLHRKPRQRHEPFLIEHSGSGFSDSRACSADSRQPRGVIQAAGRLDRGDDGLKLGEAALLDGDADRGALRPPCRCFSA